MKSSFILTSSLIAVNGWWYWQRRRRRLYTTETMVVTCTLLLISLGMYYAFQRRHQQLHPSVEEIPRYSHGQIKLDTFELNVQNIPPVMKKIDRIDVIEQLLNDPLFYTQNREHYDAFYQVFLEPLNQKIWSRSLQAILERREQNRDRLRYALIDPQMQKIPRLTHCVWISDSKQPYLIPKEKIDRFFTQLNAFSSTFTHCLWFLNLTANAENVQQFIRANTQKRKLEFLDLVNESVIDYGKDLFDVYYHRKRYTLCSDIIRYNLLYVHGGIYFDLGTIFKFDVESMLWLDYFSYQEGFVNSNSTMAAKPRSFVFYAFLNLLDNLWRFRDPSIRQLQLPHHMVSWSSLAGWTWCMDNFLPSDEMFLPIDKHAGLIEPHHSASWVNGSLGQPSVRSNPVRPEEYMFTRRIVERQFYSSMKDSWGIRFTKYFAQVDKLPIETIRRNRKKLEETFENMLTTDSFPREIAMEPKIPRILHKSWLTRDREIPQKQLRITYQTYQILRQSYHTWRFIFWTNRVSNIPETVAFLRKFCPEMEIREVQPTHDIPLARFIYQAFLEDGRYANANDILRLNIIRAHGGLYLDMGVQLEYDLTALLIPFENVFAFHSHLVDTGIVGAAPNDPFWDTWLNFLENREYKKQLDRTRFRTPSDQMALTGAHRTMHVLDSKFSDRKVLFLYDGFYIKLNRMGSWYTALQRSSVDLWNL